MIWACLQESSEFKQLAMQFQKILPGDDKAPLPHITLARIKNGKTLKIPLFPEMKNSEWEVKEIELMESAFGNSAPVYKTAAKFGLK